MSRTERSRALPIANYEPAIARAVRWLGNRYLLAAPINATHRQASFVTPRKFSAR
jgi:hypothetical protein